MTWKTQVIIAAGLLAVGAALGYAMGHRGTRIEETDKKTTTSSTSSSSSSTAATQEHQETTSAAQAHEVRHVVTRTSRVKPTGERIEVERTEDIGREEHADTASHVDLSTQAMATDATASNSTTTEEHKRVEESASSALSLVGRLQWDPLHFKPQQPEWIAGLEYRVLGPVGVYANVGQHYRDDSGALDFQVRAGLQLKLDLL